MWWLVPLHGVLCLTTEQVPQAQPHEQYLWQIYPCTDRPYEGEQQGRIHPTARPGLLGLPRLPPCPRTTSRPRAFLSASLTPTFVVIQLHTGDSSELIDLAVDEARNIIYSLSAKGSVQVSPSPLMSMHTYASEDMHLQRQSGPVTNYHLNTANVWSCHRCHAWCCCDRRLTSARMA